MKNNKNKLFSVKSRNWPSSVQTCISSQSPPDIPKLGHSSPSGSPLCRGSPGFVDSAIFSSVFLTRPPRPVSRSRAAERACALHCTRASPPAPGRCRGESTGEPRQRAASPAASDSRLHGNPRKREQTSVSAEPLVYRVSCRHGRRTRLVHEPVHRLAAGVEESRDSANGVKSWAPGGRFFVNNSKSI